MTALDIASKPPGGADRFAPFLSYLPNLLPDGWFVLRFSGAPQETVLARCGAVEIRRTEEGCAAQTRVKGEREQALATALHRLRQFLCRNERSGVDLRLSRPLVISEEAPCRWLVRIGLRGRHSGIISPASRGGRVKIVPVACETVAVLRLAGQVKYNAIERAAETILGSIAGAKWVSAGDPVVRLTAPPSSLPFFGHYEVAVPVAERAGPDA